MALPVADAWVPPPAIDEFAILRPLGRGGMGHVYLARDTLLERLVAIKLMHRYSDAIARERFVVEARAAARIQHPNVVAVYRIGEIGGHPFIVSEYLDGASLADVPVPMPWRDALEVGRGLARGLAAAHAHGVLHRDIKPANAIRSAAGAVKLLDFGLAKLPVEAGAPGDEPRPHPGEAADARRARALASTLDPLGASPDPTLAPTLDPPGSDDAFAEPVPLRRGGSPAPLTRHGAVMGTPGYMPPEAWRGDPATPRSDVYSLGALLLFLCTGREPHARVPLAQLAAVTAEQDVPGVATLAAGIDPAFAAVIDRCLARDPAARFASAAAVLDALESIGARPAAVPEGNPYRGLLPFDGAHRSLFFGRGADVRAVTERLRAAPFVLVAGQSGVGKSSLCRAGVLPLFVEGGLGDERRWSALVTSPGRAPTMALRAALSAAGLPLADPLEPGSLVGALGAERGLVLFVDQLEELLTLGEPAQVEGFCVFLAELVRAAPPNVRVLATARGDHFTRLAELPALGPAVERAFHLLRPMDRPAIREAIEGPARTLGAAFESEAMVEALVDAGAAGGLPPLQFALANLWEARDGGQLTSAALARIGGVEGALARHADEVASGMAGPVRAAARRVLLRLVTAERTRAHRSAAELATDDAARAAIEVLVRGRLVIARDEPGGEAEYTIAHEALVTRWDTLRRWIEESGETRHARERVAAAAAEWEKLERSPDALLRGRRLQEARGLEASELSSPERALVQASVRAARLGLGLRGAALAAIPALIAAVYFAQASLHRREVARRVAQELAAGEEGLARAAASEAVIAGARRRAFEAFDLGNTERAEGAWAEALAGAAEQEAILAGAAVAIERALALDPRREQSRREMAGVLHALALAAERDHRGKRARDLRQRVAIYDDGTLAAGDDEPATLTLAVSPPGTKGTIAAYTADASGRRSLGPPRPLAAGGERLAPGSYLVGLSAPGFAEVRYPVELGRGERLAARVDMLPESQVPDGFVHVPEGRFWFGSAEVEEIRKWQSAAPAHHRRTPPFLVARREATHAEWIAFLQAQPPERREAFLPKVTAGFWGTMALAPAPGGWELTLQPTQHAYVVRTGERLRYRDRVRNAEVDWAELPVSGVSWAQARVYLSWLSGTGAVPGARPCREDEWERAARGADLRVYPHGDALLPEDANFDETYHRKALAFGPDEAGAHPASQSPFGLDDMVGNVFELTASARSPGEVVIRGGSYYVDRPTSQLTNRNVFQPDDRIPTVGFRVCADVPR